MPFWQLVQRCANCLHWKSVDPSAAFGKCEAPRPVDAPFWMAWPQQTDLSVTRYDQGYDCDGYVHGKHKPHPLDAAPAIVVGLNKDDTIGLRTYTQGSYVSRTTARVVRVTTTYAIVQVFGREYRMRMNPARRERGGTLVDMPEWGLDLDTPVTRASRPKEQWHRAAAILHDVQKGDKVRLLGYPPFEGKRKRAHVLRAGATELLIRCGQGPKLRMYRTGPMAGLLVEDPTFVLDTTEETHAPENT